MPRILRPGPPASAVVLDFEGMTGALLMPTAKGSRISTIRTSALVADAQAAYLTALRYTSLVSPTTAVLLERSADTTVSVLVASVTITALRKARIRHDDVGLPRTYQIDAVWELAA